MVTTRFSSEAYLVNDLEGIAASLLKAFPSERVYAIYGEMGAGKTTFVKYLCKNLGVGDVVSSPSFSIVNEYATGQQEKIFHFDFYRIKKLEEVFDMGYEEYFFSGNYCFIEWPEKIETLLPPGSLRVYITDEAGMRHIRV